MSKTAKASQRRGPRLTNTDDSRQLKPRQLKAIELIVQGKNDREVAEAVEVTRQTAWEWRQRNPDFIAALNDRRQQIWGGQTDRLRRLAARAVDVLECELDGDNAMAAAVHVLKAVGLYGNVDLKPRGPVCPDEVRDLQAQAKADGMRRRLLSSL